MTIDQIKQIALLHFSEKEYEGTSLSDIAVIYINQCINIICIYILHKAIKNPVIGWINTVAAQIKTDFKFNYFVIQTLL